LSTADETLADGAVYTRPDPPPPDHTHDHETVTYDPATDTWSTPWREPHVTWNHIRGWRNGILSSTDHIATADDISSAIKTAWQTYRQKLRDLPQVHGATNMLKTIDLTAASPTNTQGQTIIQLTDATGITVGMDVGITTFGCPDIFASHTTVVSISSNQITLSSALVATPLSINGNAAITFSPAPTTHPWKIQPYDDPNGIYGTNKPTTTDPLFDPDPNHP
jgi:hypothetical protein